MDRSWIRKHPFFIICISTICIYGGLNYSGMCIPQGRWLSNEDRIRVLFERFNKQTITVIEGEEVRRIPYKSFDEFKLLNPDCCNQNGKPYDLPKPRILNRITGVNSGSPLRIRYKIKYFDNKGISRDVENVVEVFTSNCGKIYNIND